jgi:hypothetical protein
MNRKQFLMLVITLVVLGGAGLGLFWQDISAYRASGAKIGAKLLPGLKPSEVAQIRLQDAKSQVTLVKKNNAWLVRERGDYPANVQDIGDLLIKLVELKVVQSETVGESLLPRLDLAAPGQRDKGSGTLIEFRDAAGKPLTSLILGKIILKKDPLNPLPTAQNGVPAGRYVLVRSSGDTVIGVSDPLEGAKAEPGKWLEKDFFKVDRIKTLTVAGEGPTPWKITRDVEYGPWKFASGGGELDASAAVSAVNALGGLGFSDVVVDPKPEDTEKPVTVTAQTFDNLTYTLKIAGKKTGEEYYVKFTVSGEPSKRRTPEKGEKPEEKAGLDKEFAASLKKLESRIASEKARAKWTYAVLAKSLSPLTKDRAQLVAAKKK